MVSDVKQREKEGKVIKLTFKTILKTAVLPDLYANRVTDNLADKLTLQFQQKLLKFIKIKTQPAQRPPV